ncbi:chromatin remodelling complex Rsc7/Swp82 subunit-domain-containing protein [Gamsiella multidivaricata]|uniref:chromatin remodelling complex Rsc7/Swp82 subunit-domain-containing protein n=1 Tax=Gamsiella multidivaricata TaxID=101098 RepID=UPI0022203BA6|nr:chromatin remodelling complex Rsc7/Swp82 subunit-domain-containing protein [Gamsiella multidivaricata]KAI7831270.1 chromatin remodelling complex Rsc7/Swp82 subunit-domain-containing protein [Gamsiella multidivaricata]
MVDSPDSASSGTRSSRARRPPLKSPSPASASRQSLSRQSSKSAADKADLNLDMASPSPSRPRRTNARVPSASSLTAIKKEDPVRRGRKPKIAPAKVQDEEDGDGQEDEDEEEETRRTTSGRASRPTRPARNGSSGAKPSKSEDSDEEENVADGDEEISVDKTDTEAAETPEEEDLEEIEGEIEEAGEAKVTKDGELLGGREYRCRSFRMPTRGSRVYMLSMDPARVLGFRDSYLFFLKNPQLVRVNTTVEERTWMIENGMLMANFKSKLIAVVTARSIFKYFGHRIIKKGRSKVDDYYESRAVEGDDMDDTDEETLRIGDQDGSQFNGSAQDDGLASGKRKHTLLQLDMPMRQVTDLNWMYESAMAVRALNSQLKDLRKDNPKFLDPHTNIEQVPLAKQPTRCEVEVASTVTKQGSEDQANQSTDSTVLSIPRSIGPRVDTVIKVEIKGGAPAPPTIQDPNIWAVIPEDVRKALESAEAAKPKEEDNEDLTKFPLSLLEGQYQAAFPVHQARFQQPYRMVVPQSMSAHAHYIHHLYSTQYPGQTGPIMEQALLPGQVAAQDARMLQWQQQQLQQQQQQQQQQQLLQQQQQQAKLQQKQQELQATKKPETPPTQTHGIVCGALLKTGLGYCQRLVSRQGELCPNHRGPDSGANGKQELDTPRIVSAIASYPWQCNDCKLCVVCLDAGDEASLLICDDCDRGWHMSCCDPAIKEVPTGEWLCSFCAMCHSCRGTEASMTKYKHAMSTVSGSNKHPTYLCTYCTNCHDNFSKGRFCPVCLRTYRGDGGEDDGGSDVVGEDENNMVCCDECNRWVHMDCDGELSEEKVEEMGRDESLKYTCPPCAGKVARLRTALSVPIEVAMQSLQGHTPPQPKVCGTLGGKMRIRGLVEYQGKKLGVPEIIGSGVEYDRKLVMELTALRVKSVGATKRKKGRPSTKSPARRASIASTSSSLSSLTGSVDS